MSSLAPDPDSDSHGPTTLFARLQATTVKLDRRLRDPDRPERTAAIFGLLLAVELLVFAALKLPTIGRLELFLFRDWGTNLTAQDLIDRQFVPIQDFYYPYGLLPLAIGRVWFGLLGYFPWAYLGLVACLHILVAWGLARAVVALRAGLLGATLMVVALPLAVPPTYPNICHGIEAVCLIHGLAELASGRRARALVLATIGVLAKPSMAYLFGAALVVLLIRDALRAPGSRWVNLARRFAPAAGVGVGLSLVLGARFGISTQLRGLLPFMVPGFQDRGYYRETGYGFFFGSGRDFWLPPNLSLAHYWGTQRTYWVAATFLLTVGAIAAGIGRLQRPGNDRAVLICCAVLHLAFVFFFFGHAAFWISYAYLLVIGMAALINRGRGWRAATIAVMVLALASNRSLPREIYNGWREVGARPAAIGLWTTPDWAASWREVQHKIAGRGAVLLSHSGCATVLDRELAPAVGLFLMPGMDRTKDVQHKAEQIRAGEVVLIPTAATQSAQMYRYIRNIPLIQQAMADYRLTWSDPYFEIFERSAGLKVGANPAP